MPNPQYADARSKAKSQLSYDKSTMARPTKQGSEKLKGTIYSDKDSGSMGDMQMRYGTADWKMPGGFKTQPRDRTWGMRKCDGVVYDEGLGDSEMEGVEGPEDTYVSRGSVSASAAPRKKAR